MMTYLLPRLVLLLVSMRVVSSQANRAALQSATEDIENMCRPLEEEMGDLKLALLDRIEALSVKLEWALGSGKPPTNSSRFLQLMEDMKARLVSLEDSVANGRCDPVVVKPECPLIKCPPPPVCPPLGSVNSRRRTIRRIFRHIG